MTQTNRKVALVTGSSSGIGEAVALTYAKLDYYLILTGRNETRLNQVAAKCKELSPSQLVPLTIKADFIDAAQVDNVFDKTIKKFNKLDILINNAGYAGGRKMIDKDADFMTDYNNIMTVNLTSAVRLSQLFLPYLKQTKGSIINVSSIASRIGIPSLSYSVSKAGMSMLTRSLANVVGTSGVRVNTVSPGPIATNFGPDQAKHGVMTTIQRSGDSQEVADLIVFLTSDKSQFIQGSEFDIDGGTLIKSPLTTNKLEI